MGGRKNERTNEHTREGRKKREKHEEERGWYSKPSQISNARAAIPGDRSHNPGGRNESNAVPLMSEKCRPCVTIPPVKWKE